MTAAAPPDLSLEGLAPPWTPEGVAFPHPWFLGMLRERPVAYDAGTGMWHLFRYDDVHEFMRDSETWSLARRLDRMAPEQRVLRLLLSDPPEHVRLRNHFSSAYRPRRIAGMEAAIREEVRKLLRQGLERRRFDFINEFAQPLTTAVICNLIGVPEDDVPEMSVAVTRVISAGQRAMEVRSDSAGDPAASGPNLASQLGGGNINEAKAMDEYFQRLAARRRAEPRDDMITNLAQVPENDELHGKLDIGGLLAEQIGAGQNTTVHLTGGMMALLIDHPEQLALLRARPELIPSCVEEAVRYHAPLIGRPRISTRPIELRGLQIPENAVAMGWQQSANLDPEVFPDPLRFDIERSPNPHISFGYGEHYCIGANLARLEARVVMEEVLRSTRDFRRADNAPLQWVSNMVTRGLAALPIEVLPA